MARTTKSAPVKAAANMMPPGKKLTPKMIAANKALAERGVTTKADASSAKSTTSKASSTAGKTVVGKRTAQGSKAAARKKPVVSKSAPIAKKQAAKSSTRTKAESNTQAAKKQTSVAKSSTGKKSTSKKTVPAVSAPESSAKAPKQSVVEAVSRSTKEHPTAKNAAAKPASTQTAKAQSTAEKKAIVGYGGGGVETVISVDEVTRQVAAIAENITIDQLDNLVDGEPYVTIDHLHAGYGKMEILHDVSLRVGRKQSLCLIGPNGAGKSTILHSIFGFTNIFSGSIKIGDTANKKDVTALSPNEKLSEAGIAYILQDKSVFPGMTVEENLWMGGFLKDQPAEAKQAAEMIFDKYPRLAARRKHLAKVLSGGERRLLEISRALVMNPEVLLVDEPSIGLEPRFIDMVFEILHGLQHDDGKTIVMVEQNAKKGLEFADIGYVLVSGEVAIAGKGDDLLANPKVGQLFLGG